MKPLPRENVESIETVQRDRDHARLETEPRPWTAPDFVERTTCAEIGAYSFQEQ